MGLRIKKTLGVVFSFVLFLGLVSEMFITSKASSYMCQVREDKYGDMESAIQAWTAKDQSTLQFPGGTLKLLRNVEVNGTTTLGYSFLAVPVLDLGDFSYKYTGSSEAFVIGGSYASKLTITGTDNGILDTTGKAISITHGSEFILNGGTVKGNINVDSIGGNITIDGGTVKGDINHTSGRMSINDGVIDGNLYFGALGNISGGKILGKVEMSSMAKIDGGYFKIKPSEDFIFNGCAIEEKKKQKDWKYSDCPWRVVRADSIVPEEPESETEQSGKTSYNDVAVKSGYVRDITGTKEATAETNTFNLKIENSDSIKDILSLTDSEIAEGVNVWLDVKDMGDKVSEEDKKTCRKSL